MASDESNVVKNGDRQTDISALTVPALANRIGMTFGVIVLQGNKRRFTNFYQRGRITSYESAGIARAQFVCLSVPLSHSVTVSKRQDCFTAGEPEECFNV